MVTKTRRTRTINLKPHLTFNLLIPTLGAEHGLVLLILHPLPPHIAEADPVIEAGELLSNISLVHDLAGHHPEHHHPLCDAQKLYHKVHIKVIFEHTFLNT